MLSLTAALMFVFVVGYSAGLAVDDAVIGKLLLLKDLPVPGKNLFEPVWSLIYLSETIVLTATFADAKLRKNFALWAAFGVLYIICCRAFFAEAFILSLGALSEISIICAVLWRKYYGRSRSLCAVHTVVSLWFFYLTALNWALVQGSAL